MKKLFQEEVLAGLTRTSGVKPDLLTEQDIQHLPSPVQKYIRYTGAIGMEKVINVRIRFTGKIRSNPESGWMLFSSEQYNFFDRPTRVFSISARKMGIPVTGLHLYKDETAIMVIKLAGLFTVADARGPEMNQGETVTVFNDMCFMAPATLIDKNIQWETVDPLTVNARYTNGSITIGARLFFDESGKLINFISNDRYETADGKTYKNYPWVTPVKEYGDYGGYKLASSASAIYRKPEGDNCYGTFELQEIKYNCKV